MEPQGHRKHGRDISNLLDPSKVPGSSFYAASNGTDLGVQAIFAGSMFILFITLFSILRLRWPFIFSPRTRLTITAPPFLSPKFFGWFMATMRTPETHILNTVGLDSVIFLRFYKMCMRLLLDVAFLSLVIIWPINIRWSKVNLGTTASAVTDDGSTVSAPHAVTDYLFNLTLNTRDPKQKWNLIPHIVFAYIFSGLAYYHLSRFSSRWASLRWHFLMCSRHAMVSRTVMLTGVPRHLASSPRELEWFWGPGLRLGKIERVRVCPFNTKLTSGLRERARYLLKLEHAIKAVLGNPCVHPEYDPERLKALIMDPSEQARAEANQLLLKWAKPSRKTKIRKLRRRDTLPTTKIEISEVDDSPTDFRASATVTASHFVASCARGVHFADSGEYFRGSSQSASATPHDVTIEEVEDNAADDSGVAWALRRPKIWVKAKNHWWQPWKHVDAIDYWRAKFLESDKCFRELRRTIGRERDEVGRSTTAFVTFEDAASAHMVTQLSCYPNPGYMKARLAPEPRGVYWPNVWISNRRKWALFTAKWFIIFVIWAFWCAPVILVSSLLTPTTLQKVWPSLDLDDNKILRSLLSTTVPSVFLLLFLNMLPWILKQVHFFTGVRTKPDIDYSVLTKMWAFLVFNVILVFGFSGTFWEQILDVVNNPGTVMQSLATNIPKVGTFFTGYILVLGIGYQPFKLLQLRPVIWHIGRQWLCNTPRDYARLVSPVYIDWYSVYPYPLMVFAIAMIYSTFSPPVVVGAVIYFVIGYPVMKYLLLYVYFHPFETAGMAWPRVCRRMIFSIIIYQVVMMTFVIVKGGGWYTFSMVPLIMLYLWFFYLCGWSLEKQGTVLPVYLWRNPPPNSSYPLPPETDEQAVFDSEKMRSSQSIDSPWPQRKQSTTPLAGSRRPNKQLNVRKLNVSVAQRQIAASGHRRESSRSARTRDIILSRTTPADHNGAAPGSSPVSQRRRRKSSTGNLSRATPRQAAKMRKPSSTALMSQQRIAKKRKRKYKSLAEAATTEGSRLLISLTRLPAELHSRYSSANQSKQQNIGRQGEESKRWSMSLLNPFSKDDSSGASQGLLESESNDDLGDNPPALQRVPADSGADINLAVAQSKAAQLGQAPLAVRTVRSPLSMPPVRHQLSSAAAGKKPSMLRQEVRIGSQRRQRNVEDGNESEEWSDVESESEDSSDQQLKPQMMTTAMTYPASASQPGQTTAALHDDWDPLVYLKQQPSTDIPAVRNAGTLGTLLNSVPNHRLDQPGSSSLRRRRPYNSGRSDSVSTTDHIQGYQSDTESAQGVERARAYADSLAPTEGAGFGTRAKGTLQRIRDYFLADFRPARPILDLTYDKLYTQGDEERERNEAALADSLPQFRELLGRVLPRSMSRNFVQSPTASSQQHPTSVHTPAHGETPTGPKHVRSGSVITPLGENAYINTLRGFSPWSAASTGESVYNTAPPARGSLGPAFGKRISSHSRSQSAAVPMPLMRGLTTPISRTSTSPQIGENNQSLAQVVDGFSNAVKTDSSQDPQPAESPRPLSSHARSKSVHALMGIFTRKPSTADKPRSALAESATPLISAAPAEPSLPPLSKQAWLPLSAREHPYDPNTSAHGSAGTGSVNWPPRLSREPSSIGSAQSGVRSTHKNSLPPPRIQLTTRMVTELNYPTRRTATASVAPYLLPPRADPNGDQLIANYQRFAVEAQSRFAADEFTDYSQTPMLNVFGVLDRGIQDYVHPGLVGELPTLWLPEKKRDSHEGEEATEPEHSGGGVLDAAVEPEFAASAPQWVVNRLFSYRMPMANPNANANANANEGQFYPSAADHEELREVRIQQDH